MKLAVMQPYFFPYIGYFQLIRHVDKFVIYDDVNFIKKGWVNRNRILVNSNPTLFTIPLSNASQNKLIKDIWISADPKWKTKLLKTIEMAYKKAPYFSTIFPALEQLIGAEYASISQLNIAAIRFVCHYLEITTELLETSSGYKNNHLKGQHRILDICLQESASTYINPIGGMELYNPSVFVAHQIELLFLKTVTTPYQQYGPGFHPNLSLLDCLMFLNKSEITAKLENFQLVTHSSN